MNSPQILKALGLTLLTSTALVACDRDERIDETSAPTTVSSNLTAMSDGMVATLEPFQAEEAFGVSGEEFFGGGEVCTSTYDEMDNWSESCAPGEPVDLDAEFGEARGIILDYLSNNVFIEAHIEDQSRREITYLLQGKNVCAPLKDNAEAFGECSLVVDDAEMRLVVTSPEDGDIDIDVFLGKNKRYNPLTLNVWQDRIGVQGDLDNISKSAKLLANIVGEDLSEDLPPVIEGVFKVELIKTGTKSMALEASVLETIKVADPELKYDVMVGVAQPASRWTVDGSSKKLVLDSDIGASHIEFPAFDVAYGEDGAEETSGTEIIYKLFTGGASAHVEFDVVNEELSFNNVSMKAAESGMFVNGEKIFFMTLSDAISGMISAPQNGEVQVDVSAASLAMNFAGQNLADDVIEDLYLEDWTMNEQITVAVTGDAPSFLFQEDGDHLKVLSGALTISAAQRDVSITVSADQCLLDTYDYTPAEPCAADAEECVQPEEEEYDDHIFAYLEGGACE